MNDVTAIERLEQVEHIVVLMMENRSFDHMLGFLSADDDTGCGRDDVDGVAGRRFNVFDGKEYEVAPVEDSGTTKVQDPGHVGWEVGHQMARGMSNFASNYAMTREHQDPCDVMRYQTSQHVPIYNFLAREFAVCDRWFCSVPGATWPNRLSALTGEAGSRDNRFPPLYDGRSFVRVLDDQEVSWRWYSTDPASLRLVDKQYRTGSEDNFAFTEKPSLFQKRTFYTDALGGLLPSVSWIDPNFVDLGGLHGADDDHPPTDLMAGQSLVMKIYQALRDGPLWERTMLVIVYDEHGGFYDHVDPRDMPEEFRARAEFGYHGPRVPAIVVSPLVPRGSAFGSRQQDEPDGQHFLFDHTSLIRTILLRFAPSGIAELPARVGGAGHLGHLLTEPAPRQAPAIDEDDVAQVVRWWAERVQFRLNNPAAHVPVLTALAGGGPAGPQGALQSALALFGKGKDRLAKLFGRTRREEPPAPVPAQLVEATEFQAGYAAAAMEIRREGLRTGRT